MQTDRAHIHSGYNGVECGVALRGPIKPYLIAFAWIFLLLVVLAPKNSVAATGESAASIASTERWELLRPQIFGDKEINDAVGVILLDVPGRAFDAARVPVVVKALVPQTSDSFIRKLFIIVDNNPLPVAGTFTFEPNNGWKSINTEIRVNEYSNARAVIEMNTGELYMASSFIKAVGGCSAPPSSYERSDKNSFGKFNGGVNPLQEILSRAEARVRLVHPNASGMQFDQFSRTFIQPHYIHTMVAEFNGKTLFKLDTNFSLSQDPVIGFNFNAETDGELLIYALDSKNERFEQSYPVVGSQNSAGN